MPLVYVRSRNGATGPAVADTEQAWSRIRASAVESSGVEATAFDAAVADADRCGDSRCRSLVLHGCLSEDQLAQALSESLGAPVASSADLAAVDREIMRALPRPFIAAHPVAVVRTRDNALALVLADPFDDAGARALDVVPVASPRIMVAPASRILEAVQKALRTEDSPASMGALPDHESAARILTRGQAVSLLVIATAVVAGLLIDLRWTVLALVSAAIAFYALAALFRVLLALLSLGSPREIEVTDDDIRALSDDRLPFYTVLVPVYHEARIFSQLVAALGKLDYPKNRLEVMLLMEEDDEETHAAAAELQLPPFVHRVIVPPGEPRGKPRALNYGLLYARGDYCAIYDAEDIPDPQQLRKAVVAFQRSDGRVVCAQSKLNFYNTNQNALTHLFALDYSAWFEFTLPGLAALDLPIPLGGTSNHLKIEALRSCGGWDAFNVTEDADLGTRLYRLRRRTVMLDSVTLEEANSELWNWIRQRTHWTKGYMLTYLVHMRRPLRLWRELGPAGFVAVQLQIGGTFLVQLMNPVFWLLLGLWYLTKWSALEVTFGGPLLFAGNVLIFAATFSFVLFGALSCLRSRQFSATKYALVLPFYWALASAATYRALFQLFTRPHQWEKTQHGLFEQTAVVLPPLRPARATIPVIDDAID